MAIPFIDFRPAQVMRNKEVYVSYYVLDPPATNSNVCAYVDLIRPKEILMLRISDIDFDSGLLRIPPDVSKNHTERTIALGYDVMKYFRELQKSDCNSNDYIFSTDFKPGCRLYTTKNMFATWKTMREKLEMPNNYHFYSLKDTGITEMLESGMPSKFVKDLAGHHSLSMTERYLHISDARRILKANTVRF